MHAKLLQVQSAFGTFLGRSHLLKWGARIDPVPQACASLFKPLGKQSGGRRTALSVTPLTPTETHWRRLTRWRVPTKNKSLTSEHPEEGMHQNIGGEGSTLLRWQGYEGNRLSARPDSLVGGLSVGSGQVSLLEGPEVSLATSLAFLRLHEAEVLKCEDMPDVVRCRVTVGVE